MNGKNKISTKKLIIEEKLKLYNDAVNAPTIGFSHEAMEIAKRTIFPNFF